MTLLALQNALRWGSQCLLWVKMRTGAISAPGPLFPQCRTFAIAVSHSGLARHLQRSDLLISFQLTHQCVLDIGGHREAPNDIRPKGDRRRRYQLLRQHDDVEIVIKMVPPATMLGPA